MQKCENIHSLVLSILSLMERATDTSLDRRIQIGSDAASALRVNKFNITVGRFLLKLASLTIDEDIF